MTDVRRATPRGGSLGSSLALRLRRAVGESDRVALVGLVLFALGLTVIGIVDPDLVPQTTILLPIFLSSLWLWPRTLPWFIVFCLCCVVVLLAVQPEMSVRTVIRVLVTFTIAFLIMLTSFRRSTLGVSGARGESMLVDLRDRIQQQGTIPDLPEEWDITTALQSAGGTRFAGDFISASLSRDGQTLQIVVVDVSGKGVEAGTRALLLSGAFGGLESALPPHRFLEEANSFLLKQQWDEGFATAVHLTLHLPTGRFTLRKAGHPPAVWLHAGSGTWSVLDSDGPVLGLIDGATFEPVEGALQPGDALILYTDGLVETRGRDLFSGIDRLAGRGQLLLAQGFEGAARRMIRDLATEGDDGALVLVHRC